MYKRILVVVDDCSVSKPAIFHAVELACTHRAELFFFFVLPGFQTPTFEFPLTSSAAEQEYERVARTTPSQYLLEASAIAEAAGVHSHRSMGSGKNDAECVSEAAVKRQCDLIVVESENKNAVLRLIGGSIVPGLITSAKVPVFVCKEGAVNTTHLGKSNRANIGRRSSVDLPQ